MHNLRSQVRSQCNGVPLSSSRREGAFRMGQTYFLSPHVHVCVAGEHVLLLDLERDKYLAIVPPHGLARWVSGWPVKEPAEVTQPENNGESLLDKTRGERLLSQLIAQGAV